MGPHPPHLVIPSGALVRPWSLLPLQQGGQSNGSDGSDDRARPMETLDHAYKQLALSLMRRRKSAQTCLLSN